MLAVSQLQYYLFTIAAALVGFLSCWAYKTTVPSKSVRHKRHLRNISKSYRYHELLGRIMNERGAAAVFSYLRKIDSFCFEEVVLTALSRRGLAIERNRRYTGDGGIDGQVWINGELLLLQVKRYRRHIDCAHVEAFSQLCTSAKKKGLF